MWFLQPERVIVVAVRFQCVTQVKGNSAADNQGAVFGMFREPVFV